MRLLTPENGDVSSLTDTGTKIQISPNVPNLNMKGIYMYLMTNIQHN